MKHVLIIDDEYDITRFLAGILEDAGYKTTVAENGRKGIQRFRQDPADLVIADIFMPDKDGIEVICELRKEFPQVRLIAISGGGQTGKIDFLPVAQKLGAHYTLHKPIKSKELLQLVGKALGEKN